MLPTTSWIGRTGYEQCRGLVFTSLYVINLPEEIFAGVCGIDAQSFRFDSLIECLGRKFPFQLPKTRY